MKNSNISIIILNKKGMGIGNIKRCFHLSQLLKKKIKIFPILIGKNKDLLNPFKKNFLKLDRINSQFLIKYLSDNKIKKVIIDYYFFPSSIIKELRKRQIKIIKISDFKEKNEKNNYDLILNQYNSDNKDKKNLGTLIVNPTITKFRNIKKERKISIFFGYESSLNMIINFIRAIEKVDNLKNYKKVLILFGKYKFKPQIFKKFNNLYLKQNPSNYFRYLSKSELAFGAAGTSAIEREILKIYSLNFIITRNQHSTKTILKKSKYSYFNKYKFKNNLKYFVKEISIFLRKKNLAMNKSNNLKLLNGLNNIKLIEKI